MLSKFSPIVAAIAIGLMSPVPANAQFFQGLADKLKEATDSLKKKSEAEKEATQEVQEESTDDDMPEENPIDLARVASRMALPSGLKLEESNKAVALQLAHYGEGVNAWSTLGVASLPPINSPAIPTLASYQLAGANAGKTGKLVALDDNPTYMADMGGYVTTARMDKNTQGFAKSILKDKVGLMEPIYNANPDGSSVYFDKVATEKAYAALSQRFRLRPLSETVAFGTAVLAAVNKAISERVEQSKKSPSGTTTKSLFDLVSDIKSASAGPVGQARKTEMSSIYNAEYFSRIEKSLDPSVQYLLILNRSNYLINEAPQVLQETLTVGRAIESNWAGALQDGQTSKIYVLTSYHTLKNRVQAHIDILRRGLNYSEMSIEVFSVERLRNLTESGTFLDPDLRFSVLDSGKLSTLLDIASMNIASEPQPGLAYQLCKTEQKSGLAGKKSGGIFDLDLVIANPTYIDVNKCLKPARATYKKLWEITAAKPTYVSSLAEGENFRLVQIDRLLALVGQSSEVLGIAGKVSSTKLK